MKYCVYQFEAVSIQDYIMASAKLKEMVGASQLLEGLTTNILDACLNQLGFKVSENMSGLTKMTDNQILFPRKAGGVFLAVMKAGDKAQELTAVWPLIVQQAVPGLKFSVVSAIGNDIKVLINDARQKLTAQKNTPKIVLPELTPIAMRSPRTGSSVYTHNKAQGKTVSIDYPTHIKQTSQNKDIFQEVTNKWLPKTEKGRKFPKIFDHTTESDKPEQFPLSIEEGEHTVAIVHADGNGIGQYIRTFFTKIAEEDDVQFLQDYQVFSQGMDTATKQAANIAMQWLINKIDADSALPIRPLILSGDDVTCIIASQYAFGFMQKLTQSFETESAKELKKLQTKETGFPANFTMTTGMVFLRSNQPFYLGYQLAEDLCRHSKKLGRKYNSENIPSTLSYFYITSTLFENVDDQLVSDFTANKGQLLTQECYRLVSTKGDIKKNASMVDFDDLISLGKTLHEDGISISFIRELVTNLKLNPSKASQMIKRKIEIGNKDLISKFTNALKPFGLNTLEELLEKQSPLNDLIALNNLPQVTEKLMGDMK